MFEFLRSPQLPYSPCKAPVIAQLFRHCESVANAGLRTSTMAGIQLTDRGHCQAQEIAARFVVAPSRFVVSSYLRTQQSAAPSIARFPTVPVETWPIHEFTYLAASQYDGTTSAERLTGVANYWERCDPNYRDGLGSETFEEFVQRVDQFIVRLQATSDLDLAVFTHGHFIRATMMRLRTGGSSVGTPMDQVMRDYATCWRDIAVENAERFLLVIPPSESAGTV